MGSKHFVMNEARQRNFRRQFLSAFDLNFACRRHRDGISESSIDSPPLRPVRPAGETIKIPFSVRRYSLQVYIEGGLNQTSQRRGGSGRGVASGET